MRFVDLILSASRYYYEILIYGWYCSKSVSRKFISLLETTLKSMFASADLEVGVTSRSYNAINVLKTVKARPVQCWQWRIEIGRQDIFSGKLGIFFRPPSLEVVRYVRDYCKVSSIASSKMMTPSQQRWKCFSSLAALWVFLRTCIVRQPVFLLSPFCMAMNERACKPISVRLVWRCVE